MNKHNIKRILICLVLLVCLIGAASASDVSDVSLDDSSVDAVAIDAVSEDTGDTISADTSGIQANASQELIYEDYAVEQTKNSLSSNNLKDGEVSNAIYVATTGSDENDGSSSANAVASISKAVAIANATEGSDFTIHVANGVYNVSKIESPEGKNINLIGESKEGTIVGGSDVYAINVYQDNVNWTIENFTFCDFNSSSSTSAFLRCFSADSNFVVSNCIFRNIGSKNGAIYITSTGTRSISNCLFEDNFGTYSSTSSIIHLYGEGQVTLDNIEITGSYIDPSVGTATYLRSIIYADQAQTNVVLKNSKIHDNNGSMGSIIEAKGTFNVVNTTITDNYINYSSNGINGGTYLFYSGTSSSSASKINITQSVIADNTIAGGSIGLFNLVYGTHNMEKSVIMNNKYRNGNDVSLGSVSGSSTTLTVDNNYWGTNERPNTRASQWVILTADVPEYAFVGVDESIPIYLNTYNNTAGVTGEVTGMADVTLGVTYALNQANPSAVTISNGEGAIGYTATFDGDETVTLSTGDAFSFEVNADVSTLIYVDGSVETTGTGTSESPYKTIAEALNVAADGKIVVIRAGTYTEKDLLIDDDITVKADKNAAVVIDANNEGRVFTVSSTAILKDLTLIKGLTAADGGAIYLNGGDLTLNNVKIYNSTALNGGAIADTASANLNVVSSEFIDNTATNGGAIYVAGTANITGNKFASNDPDNGGAIYVAGTADIETNDFTSNEANNGGAIYIDSANAQTVKDNTFSSNVADHNDAIYIKNAAVDLSGNTLGVNEVIYLESGSVKTNLKFLGGNTITADFNQALDLTATLTDDAGNAIRGGSVTFTANGETVATVDLSGNNELKTSYTTPASADSDVTISGSYSLDNGGSVVNGIVHLAIPNWFIGDTGYETLSEAVAAADNGDVIIGKPGTYTVNGITIKKDITIKANETGTIILDGDKTRMFTLDTFVNATLLNLDLTNGGSTGGGFASVSSTGTLNIINSTLRDLSSSSAGGAISVTSGGKVNIEGSKFENISATQSSAVLSATGASSVINIKDSSFNNINNTNDYTLMQVTGSLNIVRSNFTNIAGKYQSNWYGAIGLTSSGNLDVTESQFINITGGDGSAIYFNSNGNINVNKSVFMNNKNQRGTIYVNSPANANINYNIFVNNAAASSSNARDIYKNYANSNINANYNFWGSNSKPTSSQITTVANAGYWTIVELSSSTDTVYVGTTEDIGVQFVGTDGTENLTLDDYMPEYSFDLAVTAGSLDATEVTLEDNEATVTFTPPATEGTVTVTATPGPAELVLNVMDPSVLLVVSTDGDDDEGTGTFDSPYATIEYALSQVTETRNIIFILSTGEDYLESDLTVSGNVTIRGEDNTVTIDAENDDRIFTVTGTLTLEDVSLTGGMTNGNGGAILVNGGNLTVNNVVISDCGAANGGAIASTAGSNLTVTNSVFDGNIGMYGGAIYVGGEAAISENEFNNHEYATYGGAIYVNTSSDVIISSNVFADNDADKGETIYIENGAVSLSENTMNATDSIYLKGGSVNSVLIFLAAQTVNVEAGQTVELTASLTDDQANPIRGGTVTFTANGEDVATIDLSGNNELKTSYTVPADVDSDITISGSYSLDNGGIVANGILHPAISYWFIEGGNGYETLAQAIDAANAGDVIYYDKEAVYTEIINGKTINKKLVIKNNGTGTVTLDAGKTQMFIVSEDLELSNLNFIDGSNTQGGFISQTGGTLSIISSSFKDSSATSNNGAVLYASAGNIVIKDSVFDNLNTKIAFYHNGNNGEFNVSNSVFNDVNGSYDGWVIYSKSKLNIENTNFTNLVSSRATSSSYYGAVYSSNDANIKESQFINITGPTGAAVYVTGNLNITKSVFDNVTTDFTVIYASGTRNINYNVFLNSGKAFSGSSGNVDYNYWGTNDNPGTAVTGASINNWVIMTVSPDTLESISSGATQTFTVDFTHYTDGTANYTLADTIPELTVSASALIGALDQSEIETVAGQAVFTYTGSANGEETVTFTNENVAIPVSFVVGDGYFGIVYVAKDGSNENRGSEDAPVATIAKAIEIAKEGSGQIIINEGTYVESDLTISDDLNITAVGEVIWDANGQRAFLMSSGDVSIANITFINGNSTSNGHLIRVTGGSLAIDGSAFVSNGGNVSGTNGIVAIENADFTLTNSVFENNTATPTGTSYGIIYVSGSTVSVDNCNFTNNHNKYGVFYITSAYVNGAYVPSIAVINNSAFIGNNATSSSGGQGGAIYVGGTGAYQFSNGTVRPGGHTYVYVENCDFINNSAKYGSSSYGAATSGKGGAIYVNNNATFIAVNSRFVNNSALADALNPDGKVGGGAIFASSGEILINSCVFENNQAGNGSEIYMLYYGADNTSMNKLNISNSIIIDDGESVIYSNYTNGSLVANNNWWGTNSGAEGKVTEGITVDNWVIMNVDPVETTGFTGEAVEISVDFKHTNSTDGTVADLEGGLPEEFTVNAYVTNGTLDKTVATTEDLEAKFAFTPEFDGANVVVIYSDLSNTVPVVVMVAEKYAGPIYVAKDGDNENEGSEESPVATIEKAIELAQGKSGQIIINEGTYVESDLTISDDLNITAVGEVIWDANGQRAFLMSSGDVSIANITFINGNSTSYGHLIRVNGNSLSFDDCKFISNGHNVTGTNGIIYVNLASASFNNCHFENNTAGTGTSYGVISAVDSVLIVDGCTFVNNFNKNGMIYASGSNIGSTVIVNNTKFIGNNATSASGGAGAAIYASGSTAYQYSNGTVRPGCPTTVYVVGCEFINNTAYGGTYYSAEGGAIYVNANATVYIADSKFINNSAVDHAAGKVGRGGAIAALTGNVQISNCVFENNIATNGSTISMKYGVNNIDTHNRLNISNSVIIGSGDKLISSDYTNSSLVANNNWWGSNANPSDKVTEGITVDTWVILSADPSEITDAHVGEAAEITVNFRHTNSTDGTIAELTGDFPELTVYGYVLDEEDGEITESVLTEDNVAKLYFTPASTGSITVYAVAGNAMVPITVTVTDAPQPSTGVIYVSTSGNDANDGSYESPVATIAHAVELAGAETGSGIVIVQDGIYNENGIVINSTKAISITGNGTVIVRGNNHVVNGSGAGLVLGDVTEGASIFIINTTEDVEIKNIRFEDNIAANGGAISFDVDRLAEVNVTVDNCGFNNLQSSTRDGGAICANYITGNLIVTNSNFTNNKARYWGGAICIGYSAYEDALNLEIDNCIFENNTGNNGGALYLMARNITIKNSIVNNNSATYSPGAIYMINTTAVIDNCTITNNSARDEVSAIEIHGGNIQYNPGTVNPSNVVITNSVIENNYGREATAPAIQMQNSNMNASYCSIVNEFNLENTVTANYNGDKPGRVILDNIWWGTDDPSTTINGTNYTVDNWVIMNLEANATNVTAGDTVKVTVDFNHVIDADGTITEITGGTIPKTYTVSLTAENGTLSEESFAIKQGQSKELIFTASEANALITATSENDVATLVFVGEIPEPFTGIVYVSKDGDDANEGSEDEPVASIARAIEIATADGGSGQIIIKEGSYVGTGYNITKDLTITGEGDVIIQAETQGDRLFNIGYGSGVSNFELANLVIKDVDALYGAVIYSYANNVVLDNITVAGIEKENSRLVVSNGNLTVKDSAFANNTVSGVIVQGGNADLTIINTIFENNNASYDSTVFAVVYVSSGKGNLTIEDSKFYDNIGRQSTVRGTADTNIVVKGSEFINNTADNSMYSTSGGAIYAQAKLDVTESIFINNSAKNAGGAIFVGRNGQANITKSEFINNTVSTLSSDYNGDAIYNNGKTTVNYCIFLTNSTKYVVYNDGEEDATVNAQYNWWGTNDDPQSLAGAGDWIDYWEDESGDCQAVDTSNWIIMSVTAEGTVDAGAGSEVALTVDFKHYIDASGEIQELEDSLAQELEVEFSSLTGTLDKETATTVDGVTTATYTVVSGDNDITVKSTDAVWTTEFAAGEKSVAEMSVDMEGNNIVVTLTDEEGNPIEGKTINVVIGEDTLSGETDDDGIATIDISDLGEGAYKATISLADDEYASDDVTAFVLVKSEEVEVPVGAVVILTLCENGTSIEVTLTDADGEIIPNAEITYYLGENDEEGTTITLDDEGVAVFDFDNTVNQTIEVTYIDDNEVAWSSYFDVVYNKETEEVEVPVVANGTMDVEVADGAVVATLTDSEGNPIEGATITAVVDGEEQEFTTDADGKVTVPVEGNATVELSYVDPENSASVEYTVQVVNNTETVEVEVPVEVPVVANGTMAVETTDDAVVATLTDSEGNPIEGATITAVVDGEEQEFTTDADGKVTVPVEGNATVELSYVDPENGATVKYATKVVTNTETVEVEVPVEVPVVANGTMDVEVADGAVVATLTDSEGNPIENATVAAVVDGVEQNFTTDADGKVSIPVGDNATVELSYVDPENGATVKYSTKVVTNTETVEVEVPAPVANATVELSTENGSDVSVVVKDLDGNAIENATIVATVNGVESNITTGSEGKATIPLSGNSTVKVSYTDPANNATTSNEMSVTVIDNVVEKVVEKIVEVIPNRTATVIEYKDMNTTSVVTGVDGRIGEYFNVTLKDVNGKVLANKTVQIGFNGKVYNRTTDENGHVELQINLKAAGRYTFAIAFLGDDNYTGSFEVALITVKEQSPKLTTANKVYKASAKTKSLSATIKSASGNPVPGLKVTFTVNGKTYTAKTNSKGVATVNVSLSKKGTYSFTVKTTATDAYASVSKTGKLTIK